MNPKDIAQRNLQRERQQRGEDFQAEMRRSWAVVPASWRMRIPDGLGGTRPADEIILLQDANLLCEHKRTKGQKFSVEGCRIRPDQVRGLLDFESVMQRNKGLIVLSFYNPDKGLDEAYAFRLSIALRYMRVNDVGYIHLDDFRRKALPCARMQRLVTAEPTYDLSEVVTLCKSL